MYSTCLFCNRPLSENAVLEEFPVGRRLAFDAEKGRLWVVCRKCERWNLSPLEERWEAIEAAERLFRDTRMRVSTEQIGLARHREGLELVRIGHPLRPEFAAWRYGDQFGRRRRRAIFIGVGATAVFGAVAVAGLATGAIGAGVLGQSGALVDLILNRPYRVKLRLPDGKVLKLNSHNLSAVRWRRERSGDWSIVVQPKRHEPHARAEQQREEHVFTGPEAERVAGLIMPRLNSSGASARKVQTAVSDIERAGGPQEYLAKLIAKPPLKSIDMEAYEIGDAKPLAKLPTTSRLALEMVLHEEQERRALEGELKALELAWQAAEEIAAISDDLLIPEQVRTKLDQPRD